MTLQKSVNSILDTPGVEGLIIFDLDGSIYFKQTPDYTDTSMLEKLPQRILMMYDIIADNFQDASDFILKFEKKNLYFRKSNHKDDKDFILAILGDAGINFVSLKLVSNLAMKMIELGDQPSPEGASPVKNKELNSKLTYRGQQDNSEKPAAKKPKKTRSGQTYRGQKL